MPIDAIMYRLVGATTIFVHETIRMNVPLTVSDIKLLYFDMDLCMASRYGLRSFLTDISASGKVN